MLDDAQDHIYCGGKTDEAEKYIEPTIITGMLAFEAAVQKVAT